MTSLNVLCGICNEFYKSNDRVYSTTSCGHLFHQHCIFEWLARSSTCPQCRRVCHRNRVHRVYLNFSKRTALDNELDAASENIVVDPMFWAPLDEPIGTGHPEVVPEGAIKSGTDPDGNDAYVARVYFREDLLPCMYVPQKGGVYASYACQAHFLRNNVEVLLDCNHAWVKDCNGQVPPNALEVGHSELGETLYTGRAEYEGITLPGKVHPSHGVLYMPYNGQEVNTDEYEVLVRIPQIDAPSN